MFPTQQLNLFEGKPPNNADKMKTGPLTKNRKAFIWCLFDWANSPYPTVILTFVFSAYFTKLVAEDEISGTFLWSQTIAFSGLFMAFVAPILGAISDETGKKKIWILVFSILAILATLSLWFVLPDKASIPLALIAIVISLIAFEFCTIFYNATLIQVANSSSIGKVSGLGWAAGYIGAIICLLICLFGLVERNFSFLRLDIERSEHIRATTIVVGLWWFIFSLPFLINDFKIQTNLTNNVLNNLFFKIEINNIFNVKYSSNGYTFGYYGGMDYEVRENYFYPQATRNIMFSISIEI